MHSSAALASRAHSTKSQNACLDCNEVADDEEESEEEDEDSSAVLSNGERAAGASDCGWLAMEGGREDRRDGKALETLPRSREDGGTRAKELFAFQHLDHAMARLARETG